MAILPTEKICPACQTRFFGRKNKVFCSEKCKVDANNQKLMEAYRSLRGSKTVPIDKANYAGYPNNTAEQKAHYSDKEKELVAQNQKLQEEIEHLKQALARQTTPPRQANGAKPKTTAKMPPEGKAKAKELTERLKKQQSDRIAAAEAEAENLLAKNRADRLAEAKAKAKILKQKLEELPTEETEEEKKEIAYLTQRAKEVKAKLLEYSAKEAAKKSAGKKKTPAKTTRKKKS